MGKEFKQLTWDEQTIDDCRQLVRLAIREDLDRFFDVTTLSINSGNRKADAHIVSRQNGIACGLKAAEVVIDEMQIDASLTSHLSDGDSISPGCKLATIHGVARDILVAERLILNLAGRLSGISSLTNQYKQEVAHTKVRIYDTRKTTPGWRRLEKYAVRCGGGTNHRTGLYDAILIKDNHLALAEDIDEANADLSQVVQRARTFLQNLDEPHLQDAMVELEVDTLDQLRSALPAAPDIVLLDNMGCDKLREAIQIRDELSPDTELEASGGINLETIKGVAETGVDRISIGALTHSAKCLDIGLDWE